MPLASTYLAGGALGSHGLAVLEARIGYQKWVNPAAGSTTAFASAGVAGPNTTTITVGRTGAGPWNSNFDGTLAAGTPDFARNVVITVTHATSVVALSGTIHGVDCLNRPLSEDWSVTATGTTKTFTGKKGFKRVDYVSVTAAADASADTVKVGTGQVFGLFVRNAIASGLKETAAGSVVTTGTVAAAAPTDAASDSQGTYSPATAPDGTKTYELWYLVDDLTQ